MPVPVVTENWSDRQYQRGVSAQRGWVVTGVDDENAAMQAVPECAAGTTFVLDSRLEAEQPFCERDQGPRAFHVVSRYSQQQAQGDIGPDPLDQPIRYSWAEGGRGGRTDVDALRRPLLNAAAVPILNGADREVPVQFFTVTRNESTWDASKAMAYCSYGAVNKDSVIIKNIGRLEPGQLLIRSYKPTHDWDERSRYLEIAYRFEMCGGEKKDEDGLWDGFKYRIPNVSLQGWALDPLDRVVKLGRFVNAYGEPLTEPVPLDQLGKPFNPNVRVALARDAKLEPVETPQDKRLDIKLFESTGTMTFLKYIKFPIIQFAGLNLF